MRVAVVGAGLQGSCVALELADRGVEVDLLDGEATPMARTSLRNEGKIHLGLVYANAGPTDTASVMLDGALQFGRLLDRWTHGAFASVARSTPFTYLVAEDSMVPADQLHEHYATIEREYHQRLADPDLDYLGGRPRRLWRPVDQPPGGGRGPFSAAVQTVERAVHLPALAAVLRTAVARHPQVRVRGGSAVEEIRAGAAGYALRRADDAPTLDGYDQVVNAAWAGRLDLDVQAGLPVDPTWTWRLKYRVLVELPPELRTRSSATIVLGPYGDVVVYPDGSGYLSWYPTCMRDWSEAPRPPDSWMPACRGRPDPEVADTVARETLQALDPWFPGVAAARPVLVDAGVIGARAVTDIGDPASRLHRRDESGVTSRDGYHSVDTGKLTLAPRHAIATADAVCGAIAHV